MRLEKLKVRCASGPSGVGVNELRRRLIEMNPNVFQGAVPRTCKENKDPLFFFLCSVC